MVYPRSKLGCIPARPWLNVPFRKCSKFVPGKKSAVGDKVAIKRHQFPIPWDRVPFAIAPLLLPEHLVAQKATVNKFLDCA